MTLSKFAKACKAGVLLDLWLLLDKEGTKMHLTNGVALFAGDVAAYRSHYGAYNVKSVDDIKGDTIRLTLF